MVDIYCPNCGERGHHLDYCLSEEDATCSYPRIEAFVKYPTREYNIPNKICLKFKFIDF